MSPRRLRVLVASHTSRMSGAELSLLDLLRGLPASVEPIVGCPPGPLVAALADLGVATRSLAGTDGSLRLHPTRTPLAVAELARAAVALRRLCAATGADVVHANSIRAGLVSAGARVLGAPPTLVHVRDRLPPGRAATLSLRLVARGNDMLVANSEFTASGLAAATARTPLRVVHNPVDLARFDPTLHDRRTARARLELDDDDVVLAIVAQLTPWKAQDDAIRVTGLLRDRGWPVRLLVVGAAKFVSAATRYDNRAYERGLPALAAELGLRERVDFTGERSDVALVLRATDVLLVPSWSEPFGRTVLEGMAMGVLVAATSVGGPAEIIRHGVDGLLLAPRRPQQWATAIERLLVDPARRDRIAAAARQRARAFDRDRHVEAIVALYRELAGR